MRPSELEELSEEDGDPGADVGVPDSGTFGRPSWRVSVPVLMQGRPPLHGLLRKTGVTSVLPDELALLESELLDAALCCIALCIQRSAFFQALSLLMDRLVTPSAKSAIFAA